MSKRKSKSKFIKQVRTAYKLGVLDHIDRIRAEDKRKKTTMARIGPCNSDHPDGCCCTVDRNELLGKLKLFEHEAELCACAKCGHVFTDYSVSVCTVWPDGEKPWWARTVFHQPLCHGCERAMSREARKAWQLAHPAMPNYAIMGAWTRPNNRGAESPTVLSMSRTRTLFRGCYSGCPREVRRMGDVWAMEPPWYGDPQQP